MSDGKRERVSEGKRESLSAACLGTYQSGHFQEMWLNQAIRKNFKHNVQASQENAQDAKSTHIPLLRNHSQKHTQQGHKITICYGSTNWV